MVFKCHQPRREEFSVLFMEPLLNCRQNFLVRPEMTSTHILFQIWKKGSSRLEPGLVSRQGAVLIHTNFAPQHPLQLYKCGLLHCPIAAKHLWRVYNGVFREWRSSAGLASFHSMFRLLYFSWVKCPTK